MYVKELIHYLYKIIVHKTLVIDTNITKYILYRSISCFITFETCLLHLCISVSLVLMLSVKCP